MPKSSSLPSPGDSTPDFSQLSEHDDEGAPPDWSSNDPEASEESSEGDRDVESTDSGDDGEHVIFDAGETPDPEALSDETLAMPGRDVDVLPQNDDMSENVDSGEESREEPAAQLTVAGIPAFEAIDRSEETSDLPELDDSQGVAEDIGESEAKPTHHSDDAESNSSTNQPSPKPSMTGPLIDPDQQRRQRMLLILLASYASAMTIAFLWMWLSRNTARPHELENLPDVAPLNENEFRYAPANASMPKGHTLPLGSQRKLGHILIEPLRITREPVEYEHFSDASKTKPASSPTLKLWLRFTNQSDDQLIAPLDPKLLFTRKYNDVGETELANQIVLPMDKRESVKPVAYVLEHPETSEWDLKDQRLSTRLKPGESLETYLPLEPAGAESLSGDLLWRVHLRKGFHSETGHGVTTMIEIPFNTSEIVAAG